MRDYEENTLETSSYFTQPVLTRLVSKKFIVFLIVLVALLIMLYTGQISGTNVTELLYVFVPSYFGTDIVQNTAITHIESKERMSKRKRKLPVRSVVFNDVNIKEPSSKAKVEPIHTETKAPVHTEEVTKVKPKKENVSTKPARIRLKPIKR